MVDTALALKVVLQLQSLVEREPGLSQFRFSTSQLVENARRLDSGDLSIGPLRGNRMGSITSVDLARAIVDIAAMLPIPEEMEAPELRRALGQLHGNVVEAIMYAVFAGFPELLRGPPQDQGPSS
jgi:hypothetical protein